MDNFSAGAAAEAYVHFRLRSWGLDAHFAGGIGTPFDLWAEHEGKILKIQVKSTSQTGGGGKYRFSTKKGRQGFYHPDDWDVLALVALPEQRVWFTLRDQQKAITLPKGCFTEEEEKKSWDRVIRLMKEKKKMGDVIDIKDKVKSNPEAQSYEGEPCVVQCPHCRGVEWAVVQSEENASISHLVCVSEECDGDSYIEVSDGFPAEEVYKMTLDFDDDEEEPAND